MIYSRWRPHDGKYDYFSGSDRVGLGDDMPMPSIPLTRNPIGVASVSLGRKPPSGARFVGTGDVALDTVMPLSSSLGLMPDKNTAMIGVAIVIGVVMGYLVRGKQL